MAIKNKQITYVHKLTDTDVLFIDPVKVTSYKNAIVKDYNNVIKDINNIRNAYKKLYADKNTQGDYRTLIKKCDNAAKKKVSNDTSIRNSMKAKLDADVQAYVLNLVTKLNSLTDRVTELEKLANK